MDPSDSTSARHARAPREVGLAVMVVALLVAVLPASPLWLMLSSITVALSLGLPLVVARSPRAAERLLFVAVAGVVCLASGFAWVRANDSGLSERDRMHDGGVIVTRAAADEMRRGRNPYTADFSNVLPESWREVQGIDGVKVPNPVVDHFPYLPAAALVHVPFVVVGEALGIGWDTRVLGCAVLALALVVLARRPGATVSARLGAVLGLGSALTIIYQAWGTNDAVAVAVALLALCVADRSPGWAGVLFAVAVSAKLLLVVLIPPVALFLWVTGGWAALRRWWSLPAVLTATCLPFLIADPSAFLDDTMWFNLGRSDINMPTSGIGLPAVAPSFDGLPLALVTGLGFVLALAGPLWAVRRWPSIWVASAAGGAALLLLLVPARTFQTNYLVLVAALVASLWLAGPVGAAEWPRQVEGDGGRQRSQGGAPRP